MIRTVGTEREAHSRSLSREHCEKGKRDGKRAAGGTTGYGSDSGNGDLRLGRSPQGIPLYRGPEAAVISITNQYGPISVKPGSGNQVVVTAILHSDQAEIDQSQSGNRVDILSHLLSRPTADTGRVDYEVIRARRRQRHPAIHHRASAGRRVCTAM